MYSDKLPSMPTNYYEINDNGDIVPPNFDGADVDVQAMDEIDEKYYKDIEEHINSAVERQVGKIATGPVGKPEGMSDEEYFRIRRENLEDDRSGTHPGTSRELTDDEKKAARKAEEERRKAEKKQKKINDAIRKVKTINPLTRDGSLADELSIAKEYLRKNKLNPDDYLPDYWK